jgi:hypothetical protein
MTKTKVAVREGGVKKRGRSGCINVLGKTLQKGSLLEAIKLSRRTTRGRTRIV